MCQRVSADLGTGVGSTSAVRVRRQNSVICRQDKESAIELLVPAIWVTRTVVTKYPTKIFADQVTAKVISSIFC